MKPEFNWKKRASVGNSELDWGQVTLIPTRHLRTQVTTPELSDPVQARVLRSLLPDSDSHNHYVFARETDSALVHVRRTRDAKRPAATQGQQSANNDNQQPGVTLPPALLAMGRLAEPALVRVKFFSRDTVVRAEAALLLNELHHVTK